MFNRILVRTICVLGVLIAAEGCRSSQPPASQIGDVHTSVATQIEEVGGVAAATDVPPATATPLPPPDGWVELAALELGVIVYHPADWEVIPYDGHKLDLRAPQGDGWIEINLVDAGNALDWGAGDQTWDAQIILTSLVDAAREDGEFADPSPVPTISGGQGWMTQGVNDVIGDRLWIGVVGLGDRALIALGHGQEDTVGWESELVPTYEDILRSVQPGP